MAEQGQNPGRKWRHIENEGDGNRFFDTFRFTPYTTDLEFYRDPNVYEADEVARSTQEEPGSNSSAGPRGSRRSDESIKEEIRELLSWHGQLNAAGIQVEVNDGIVTLSGTVSSPDEKRMAEKIIENVLAVQAVKNDLKIDEQPQEGI